MGEALERVQTQTPAEPAVRPLPSWYERIPPERRLLRGRSYDLAKRGVDVGLTILASPVILPVMALCWAAVKAEAPRAKALFVQTRTGKDGRLFRMLKFRTMVPEAESLKSNLLVSNQRRWPDFKIDNDPRITRVGRFLRKTSLDELPQVWNVLKGDMSLVGPRPTSFGIETYEPWHRARLAVMPGLTGLWQVEGRGDTEFDERVLLDLAYIERRSLTLDARIMVRTVAAVLNRRGAC